MKVPFKKPSPEQRKFEDMKKHRHPNGSIQMVWPNGSAMRRYKDAKKALKSAK